MSSLVRALIARCASRSFARFLASCEGVRVETLLVPVTANKDKVSGRFTVDFPGRMGIQHSPFLFTVPDLLSPVVAAGGDRAILSNWLLC